MGNENNKNYQVLFALIVLVYGTFARAGTIPKPCTTKTDTSLVDRAVVESLGTVLDGSDEMVPELNKANKVIGFRVVKFEAGGRFELMGLNKNDILKKFNNVKLDTPAKSIEMYDSLKANQSICLSIFRNGKTLLKHIKLEPKAESGSQPVEK